MHPDVQLVVAGQTMGQPNLFARRFTRLDCNGRVHLMDPIFSQDRFTAVIDSRCFCLPSRQEGFSIAILEAMACARPVVITQACHFPEVAAAGAGEVVSLDVENITDALHRILSDRPRAEQMGTKRPRFGDGSIHLASALR